MEAIAQNNIDLILPLDENFKKCFKNIIIFRKEYPCDPDTEIVITRDLLNIDNNNNDSNKIILESKYDNIRQVEFLNNSTYLSTRNLIIRDSLEFYEHYIKYNNISLDFVVFKRDLYSATIFQHDSINEIGTIDLREREIIDSDKLNYDFQNDQNFKKLINIDNHINKEFKKCLDTGSKVLKDALLSDMEYFVIQPSIVIPRYLDFISLSGHLMFRHIFNTPKIDDLDDDFKICIPSEYYKIVRSYFVNHSDISLGYNNSNNNLYFYNPSSFLEIHLTKSDFFNLNHIEDKFNNAENISVLKFDKDLMISCFKNIYKKYRNANIELCFYLNKEKTKIEIIAEYYNEKSLIYTINNDIGITNDFFLNGKDFYTVLESFKSSRIELYLILEKGEVVLVKFRTDNDNEYFMNSVIKRFKDE